MKKEFKKIKENEMTEIASYIINNYNKGDVICLIGDLGAGKTTLSRIILKEMGFEGKVVSPSFIICCEHVVDERIINHLDFYRISDFSELLDLGLEEIIDVSDFVLIEWADLFLEELLELKPQGMIIRFENPDNDYRNISIEKIEG